MGTRTTTTRAAWVRRAVFGTLLVVALTIGGTAFRVWQIARVDDRSEADVIIVLGAAQYNGKPSPIFQARLKHAKQLYEDGVAKVIITAGGNRAGDEYTEATAGAQWLVEQGVPKASTLPVGEGRDTLGSLRAVANVVAEHGWHTAVLVSDPWHSLRARTMADDVGMEAWTSPTHSGPIVQTRQTQAMYIFRETGALLFYLLTKTPADDIGGTGLG
ncbi:YdcF family protein [Amycolatopsis acidiphila]|uniref:YdcF family protein n=1 Tax=Amycolatopsis acidiphila TaxID=715473 RepID=A0A558A6A9_9PSEU|nr:YdcF family protein [Amycolatopsis acidiphila]TVT19782.1 YdcF family protein [Amycolatopsis acidiphila]UIJ61851.1 YdcF family protein [Amycolatopsis acidiphila]